MKKPVPGIPRKSPEIHAFDRQARAPDLVIPPALARLCENDPAAAGAIMLALTSLFTAAHAIATGGSSADTRDRAALEGMGQAAAVLQVLADAKLL